MGLFEKKEVCSICNENESNKKLADGCICKSCMHKCMPFIITLSWKKITTERVHKALNASEQNNELLKAFHPTKQIEKYISFDDDNRLWKINKIDVVFRYEDIISYDLLEDGESITKGGIGSAVVGGTLFGGTGAIVGGITGKKKTKREINEFKIKIITRNEMYPEVYINFLSTGSVKSGSILYNSYKEIAQRIITEFTVINDGLNQKDMGMVTSEADEILKYKKLYDDGIITQEEFEAKKRQLLGL